MSWRILGRHKWVVNAKITESVNMDLPHNRRFTATICGWHNWKIYEGQSTSTEILQLISRVVRAIRDQIETYGEDAEVFTAVNKYATNTENLTAKAEMFEHSITERFAEFLDSWDPPPTL